MVHCQFGHAGRASPAVSDFDRDVEKVWDAVLAPEQDAGLPAPLGSGNSEQSNTVESPADPRTPSPRYSRLSTPLSSPQDSPPAVNPNRATRGLAETVPSGEDDRNSNPDSGLSEPVAGQRARSTTALARLRPREDKPAYREAPPRSARPVDRRPAPPALNLPIKQCCSPKIPPELLTVLDRWDAPATGQILYTFLSPDVPLEDMCHTHIRKLLEAVKSPPSAELLGRENRQVSVLNLVSE